MTFTYHYTPPITRHLSKSRNLEQCFEIFSTTWLVGHIFYVEYMWINGSLTCSFTELLHGLKCVLLINF